MQNKYKPPDYNIDIDEGIFDFSHHGHCVFRPFCHEWQPGHRTDIIIFNKDKHLDEVTQNLNIGTSVPSIIRERIVKLVKDNWDAFCGEGCKRPILGYEFAIDTGTATPVCKYLNHSPQIHITSSFTFLYHQHIIISFPSSYFIIIFTSSSFQTHFHYHLITLHNHPLHHLFDIHPIHHTSYIIIT